MPFDFEREAGVETYFTTKELSGYLKIPEQTIRRWVLKNEIPYNRIHGVIRYRLSEIETWVGAREKGNVKSEERQEDEGKGESGADNELEIEGAANE
jgi:excisionase family DNA binding protein